MTFSIQLRKQLSWESFNWVSSRCRRSHQKISQWSAELSDETKSHWGQTVVQALPCSSVPQQGPQDFSLVCSHTQLSPVLDQDTAPGALTLALQRRARLPLMPALIRHGTSSCCEPQWAVPSTTLKPCSRFVKQRLVSIKGSWQNRRGESIYTVVGTELLITQPVNLFKCRKGTVKTYWMNCVCISNKNKGRRNHNCSCAGALYAKFEPRAIFYCWTVNSWKKGFVTGLLTDP